MNQKSKPLTKIILLVVAIFAIIAVIMVGIKYYNKPHSTETLNNQSEKNLPDGTTISINKDPEPSSNENVSKNNPQTANLTITQVSQNQTQVTVRVIVDGIPTGTCTLKLNKSNQSIVKDSNIQLGPSYYYCNGYVINKSEFNQKGEWELTIYAQGEGKSGTITQKINIE